MILYYYDTGAYCLTLKIVIKFIIYAGTPASSSVTNKNIFWYFTRLLQTAIYKPAI